MAGRASTERRKLIKTIQSEGDTAGQSNRIKFFDTTGSFHLNNRMNFSASNAQDSTDVLSLEVWKNRNLFNEVRRTFTKDDIYYQDSESQVFQLNVDSDKRVKDKTVLVSVNGIEQQSNMTQTTSGSSIDFYLSGSKREQVVLFKKRFDDNGITLQNYADGTKDNVKILYRQELA